MRRFVVWLCSMVAAASFAQEAPPWRMSTPQEQQLDAATFRGFDEGIATALGDVQSVVVILQGRKVYEYYRDGNPDALRDAQSVTKSAMALLVGTALQRGQLASLEQTVVDLIPEWRPLNSDPRSQIITLRHLLAMTTGFEIDDPTGTAEPLAPAAAWTRPVRTAPGERFAYDNSGPLMVQSILERITNRRIADLVHDQLVTPLGLREPQYSHNSAWMRTVDMVKVGYLLLQDGRWADHQVLPPGFVAQLARPQSAGGPPVGLPYGLGWWTAAGPTYIASGYAGQVIWVHPPLDLVVAVNSTVSFESQQRGQAMRLARGRIFQAAQKRLALNGK